jgi:plasmid stabilization system protein ParE
VSLGFFAPRAARELERATVLTAESNPAAAEAFLRAALAAATVLLTAQVWAVSGLTCRHAIGSGR